MLADTRPDEPGPAHDAAAPPASSTRLVEGSERDPRRLTVNFGRFVERLGEVPEPDHARLARLMAGADLVDGLAGPSNAGFRTATPEVPEEAGISEQLAAITDEALAAAEKLLNSVSTYEDDYDMDQEPPGLYGPEMTLALERLGNDGISAARQAIVRSSPTTDSAVGPEFI